MQKGELPWDDKDFRSLVVLGAGVAFYLYFRDPGKEITWKHFVQYYLARGLVRGFTVCPGRRWCTRSVSRNPKQSQPRVQTRHGFTFSSNEPTEHCHAHFLAGWKSLEIMANFIFPLLLLLRLSSVCLSLSFDLVSDSELLSS